MVCLAAADGAALGASAEHWRRRDAAALLEARPAAGDLRVGITARVGGVCREAAAAELRSSLRYTGDGPGIEENQHQAQLGGHRRWRTRVFKCACTCRAGTGGRGSGEWEGAEASRDRPPKCLTPARRRRRRLPLAPCMPTHSTRAAAQGQLRGAARTWAVSDCTLGALNVERKRAGGCGCAVGRPWRRLRGQNRHACT